MTGAPLLLDGAFVPRTRAGVDVVTIDGETVIHHAGLIHALDPVATVVWGSIDGKASIDDIAVDLADGFGVPAATARRDVATMIAELARLDLLTGPGPERRDDGAGPVRLADPPGSCASCADRDWARRVTLEVGSWSVTVGTDSAPVDAAIRRVLAEHVVSAGPDETAPPFLAVSSPDAARSGGPQPVHLLHRGDVVLARTRRRPDVVRALVEQLATYADLTELGLAPLRGVVVVAGERAVIVPAPADPVRYRHELGRRGLGVADIPVAIVDAARAEVVVGAPGLRVAPAIDGFAPSTSGSASDPASSPPWGHYGLVALGVPAPAAPAEAVLAFGPDRGDHYDDGATLAALTALLDSVPVVEAVAPDQVAALLGRG